MDETTPNNERGSPSPTPGRRRAPTITIDTSAGDAQQPRPIESQATHSAPSTTELRGAASFESRESRPTSPHNISSPASKWGNDPNSFLAVPGSRSRGGSFDSATSDGGQSPSISGETYINTPNQSPPVSKEKAKDESDVGRVEVLSDEDALRPDPGTEGDFQRDDNKFAFTPGQMGKMYNPKSLGAFHAVGGLKGLEKGLRTNRKTGLSSDERFLDGYVSFEEAQSAAKGTTGQPMESAGEISRNEIEHTESRASQPHKQNDEAFADRKRIFADNRLPERKSKTIFQLAWIAYNDKVIILLTVAAVISLALGIYQAVGIQHLPGQPGVEWVEGVAIIVAIVIVVTVGAGNDWQKERQFVKLNKKKEDRSVKIIRSGKTQEVSVYDIFVGDVMLLEPGDMIPVDGIFIEGHNVKCDESSATGESDLLKKTPADEVYRAMEAGESVKKLDPFILSGAKVTEGLGSFLVTATGVNSSYGKTMMSLRDESEVTPLQAKLNILAEYIAKLGGGAALLLFIVLFIEFLARLKGSGETAQQKGQNFLNILIVAITIVVVAVPEGLPLAVTLALAFATTRMLKDNNLVRVLRSCETMGNATCICSDKTGTLTQNKMTVVAGTFGTNVGFGGRKPKNEDEDDNHTDEPVMNGDAAADDRQDVSAAPTSAADFASSLSADAKDLLEQSIVINSTAFEGEENGEKTFVGSKTETALLNFAKDFLGMGPVAVERSNAEIAQIMPFDSGRKCMAAVVKLGSGKFRAYVKGASEIMLSHASTILRDPREGLDAMPLDHDASDKINELINTYASRSLRTIGFLYQDYEEWPPRSAKKSPDDPSQAEFDSILRDMVFVGVVGIQDPLRDGVPEAVKDCQTAGVFVRMVTGDNIITAKAIAEECGIYTAGGIAMEGPEFRKLSKTAMDQVIPKLQVLARSSPDDKRILVKRLKELGETVAVTGDGTNDAPALKAADVGFSMGIAGTEVAKEASAIILMDDNFTSIVKALMWGRAVNDAVKKFLQFQVTVNITAVILAFVSAVSDEHQESVLTAVQLLWVNLIMDTLAALALATDPPSRTILNRKPDPKSANLITVTMWKMIIGQSIYQLIVTFILYFAGPSIFPDSWHQVPGYVPPTGGDQDSSSSDSNNVDTRRTQLNTLVFNTFVWMTVFNQMNSRRLDNRYNIFEGITHNWLFVGIQFVMIGGQTMIIFVGGIAFSVVRLNGVQWAISIVLGLLSVPAGVLIRTIPDSVVLVAWRKVVGLIPESWKKRAKPSVFVSDEDQRYEWNPAIVEIREELAFLKKVRGGRLNNLKFKLQHPIESIRPRSGSRSGSSSLIPQTPNNEEHVEAEFGAPALPPTPDSRSRRRGRSRSNSAFGPAAAMAGIVAGSIAGWSPIERGHGDNDSLKFSRDRPRQDLEAQPGVEVHPLTDRDDKVVTEDPTKYGAPSQAKETTPDFPHGPMAGAPENQRPKTPEEDSPRKS